MSELRDCCRAYLLEGAKLIQEWAFLGLYEETLWPDTRSLPIDYLRTIHDMSELHGRIIEGEPCPWHNKPEWGINGWKNYLAVMESAEVR